MTLKKYNPETKNWEDKQAEHTELTAMRNKLIEQNIAYMETSEGIFVKDTDIPKIDAGG